MAIKLSQKKDIVKDLADKVKKSATTVIVGFNKLKIADVTPLRKKMRGMGVGFTVSKKTLLKRAFDEVKIEGDLPPMEGQVAIAYAVDAVAPAKAIAEAEKKHKGSIMILGGILEGKFLSAKDMIALSKIPGREVLYAQLLNVMNGPIQGFVGTLNGVMRDFVSVLDQVKSKK